MCGARSGLPWGDSEPAGTAGTPSVVGVPATTCPGQPNGIYLLAWMTQEMYRFDPATLSLEPLGSVSCGENLDSMEIASNGDAYASSAVSGRLYQIDIPALTCDETPFDRHQLRGITYGLAFVPDDSPAGETLYVAESSTWLSVLDLSTYELREVATFDPENGTFELVGLEGGRLFGLALGSSWAPADPLAYTRLVEVDPSTAAATTVVELPSVGSASFQDVIYWEGSFYFFIREADLFPPPLPDEQLPSVTTVYRYQLGDESVESIGTVDIDVLGAAVSSCAPL